MFFAQNVSTGNANDGTEGCINRNMYPPNFLFNKINDMVSVLRCPGEMIMLRRITEKQET